ncbi:putative ABC transporter permease [Streptomyces albus]|uniref:Putative ABC transporter permease n=1 Tax=Streptomyces albus (strain ATCC 21838 / DSM 41398 / FERM P-419 / JCM 4703 / NBRC 107858) TaxID=1081613 RepID=A0A0B5F5Z3_STRA4|nr:putative ABC transporter permease [Streptomyces albus]AOU81309.1 putative ABC transporter permease [Streptomyces albus]AYN37002.1 putative ABC transporter permease [Streptomyces albus]
MPRRGLLYGAKTAVILGAALLTGLATGFLSFLAGQAFLGSEALTLGDPGVLRACAGAGIQLALMALLAAGLTVLLRSAVTVLSLLIPFLLIVSFVVGDIAGGAAAYLPDRAGQQVLHTHPEGPLGAWQGLAVCAAWAALAALAGWWAIRRRDA